jgi:hypothetical protein
MMLCEIFLWPLKRCKISCLTKTNSCPSAPYPIVFKMSNWHYVINQWCSPLANVVIIDPIRIDLDSWATLSRGVVMIAIVQAKDGFYCNWFLTNIFLLLSIEVFECLHQKSNNIFHQCVNMAWGAKGIGSLSLLILHTFYRQRVLMALQHTQVISILTCVVASRWGFF